MRASYAIPSFENDIAELPADARQICPALDAGTRSL
jgi:hypothetical protein